jgi:hypothetical protein
MLIPIALMIILLVASPFQLVHGQPRGYTLIYSPPRGYYVDWMDVKAVYVKEEGDRLYFYVEYYGAIPSFEYYSRSITINIDTDRNLQTGWAYKELLGVDYSIYFLLWGEGSYCSADLSKWNSTSRSFNRIKDLKSNARLAPGLSYMEIWVDKQDIGYTPNGIDFIVLSTCQVSRLEELRWSYAVGSSVKRITVDGDSSDWGSIDPLITPPFRSINPSELEISSVYVANDDENLYFRIDTRGKPATEVNEGYLHRWIGVYFDTDNNDNTGCINYGGAEFHAALAFATPKYARISYFRYTRDCIEEWIEASLDSAAYNNIFEFKIPLNLLGLSSGQMIGIIMTYFAYFERLIPSSGHLTYPDTTPPSTAIILSGLKHQVGSTTYVSGSTLFELSASDDASGVEETRYRVDNGPWNTYKAGFTLATLSDGEHTISYYSIDNAGNNEAEKTLTIILDKAPPTISEASPTGTIGSTSITFTVKVEDSGSGVKEVKLIVDGVSQGTMSMSGNTYSKTISLSEGSHTWIIEAVDNVGNTATQNYSFTISTWMSLLPYLIAIAIVIVIIAAAAIMLRRRKPTLPPPP